MGPQTRGSCAESSGGITCRHCCCRSRPLSSCKAPTESHALAEFSGGIIAGLIAAPLYGVGAPWLKAVIPWSHPDEEVEGTSGHLVRKKKRRNPSGGNQPQASFSPAKYWLAGRLANCTVPAWVCWVALILMWVGMRSHDPRCLQCMLRAIRSCWCQPWPRVMKRWLIWVSSESMGV